MVKKVSEVLDELADGILPLICCADFNLVKTSSFLAVLIREESILAELIRDEFKRAEFNLAELSLEKVFSGILKSSFSKSSSNSCICVISSC